MENEKSLNLEAYLAVFPSRVRARLQIREGKRLLMQTNLSHMTFLLSVIVSQRQISITVDTDLGSRASV